MLLAYFFWYFQIFGNLELALYGCPIVAILAIGVHIFNRKEFIIDDYPFGIWTYFFVVVYCTITSIFVADNSLSALKSTVTFTAFVVICFIISYISIELRSINWLLNMIICIVLIDCIWTAILGINQPGYGRILGANNNPNTLGVIMLLGVFSLAFRFNRNLYSSLLGLVLSLLPLYTIIRCGSRKCFIATTLFLFLWIGSLTLSVFHNYSYGYLVLFLLGLVISGLVIGCFFYTIYLNTELAIRMSELNDISDNSRVYLYQRAYELFKENPFFGVGMDQYKNRAGTGGVMSHSTYAEMIADFGIVGSFIYLMPILQSIIIAIKELLIGSSKKKYQISLVLILIGAELFLGIGQVFFFDIEHFVAWTIIYTTLWLFRSERVASFETENTANNLQYSNRYKYIKN